MQTTTSDLRKEFKVKLTASYHPREADQIAAIVIEHFFGIPSTSQLLNKEITISGEIELQVYQIIDRLLKNEPIQYVLGYTEFYGRRFKTDPRALIPRPETEELVDYILTHGISKNSTVLDIGTGTGCIAISLALETGCTVLALDSEAEALTLAKENAAALGVEISFIHADILTTKPDLPALDLIVSNPPYVPLTDLASLHSRVKDYEPSQALFVPDQDPLIFYKRIAHLAPTYLVPGGQVILEIYHLMGPALASLFQEPQWSQVQIKKDLQGKDRIFKATLSSSH